MIKEYLKLLLTEKSTEKDVSCEEWIHRSLMTRLMKKERCKGTIKELKFKNFLMKKRWKIMRKM